MTSSATQIRNYEGPALFSYGFRPFFLFGGAWAAVAIALLLPALDGSLAIPSAFPAIIWHQHEMIFGYVPAVVAGFLLTAVPNWTGRLPVVGGRLALLFSLWIAGRIAVFFSSTLGAPLAAAIDLSFLAALVAVVAREIIAAGNNRNLKVLVILGMLLAANAVSHAEGMAGISQGFGVRTGIAATILLICIVGGRIVPSFTRNWLARQEPGALPVPFARFDVVVMIVTGVALGAWILAPLHSLTGGMALIAMIANAWRLIRWRGYRTAAEPLVLVLHVAFLFVPLGFGLVALSIFVPALVLPSAAIHGWTAGAIGLMTLAVMTRASLGHTGRPLTATRPIAFIYFAVFLAAALRIAVGFGIFPELFLPISAALWFVGYLVFVTVYAPLLMKSRA